MRRAQDPARPLAQRVAAFHSAIANSRARERRGWRASCALYLGDGWPTAVTEEDLSRGIRLAEADHRAWKAADETLALLRRDEKRHGLRHPARSWWQLVHYRVSEMRPHNVVSLDAPLPKSQATPELRDQALRLFVAHEPINTIALIRRETGASLKQAREMLDGWASGDIVHPK